ncbi:hypothetical protein [Hymenobacter sediminicola]|uniref:Energy transducer TonB n=1 Tax=Hymenobacter sediminicola TaxID=2761579 RepID=A0A7G7W4M1_9BACT|nr:hypothetical protein [Hymenobacter sediminicola]QNH61314.1 hypothetical protein H4317_14245 [Hymenobacter sediminicola]
MRVLLTACLLLFWLPGWSQRFVLPDGEYMDTTVSRQAGCQLKPTARYYSVNGKYPRSSDTLREQAQAFLQRGGHTYTGSGYITFRFVVDCSGKRLPRTQVLQTDARYQQYRFQPELVEKLYAYLNTLNDWRIARSPNGQETANYIAYIAFKINHGKVVAVCP